MSRPPYCGDPGQRTVSASGPPMAGRWAHGGGNFFIGNRVRFEFRFSERAAFELAENSRCLTAIGRAQHGRSARDVLIDRLVRQTGLLSDLLGAAVGGDQAQAGALGFAELGEGIVVHR